MSWTAEQALDHWEEQKLLTKKKADELRHSLPEHADQMQARAIGIFSTIGAILVGLGIILFVGSHWQEIPAWVRLGMLLIVTLVTGVVGYLLAFERKTYVKTGMGLLFLNIIAYGATIFLAAQIYHLQLDFWWGMLLWFLGTAFFAYVLQSRLHLWLSVPLLVVTIGWLRTSLFAGGEFDFLFEGRMNIFPLFGCIGLTLMALSILHNRWNATRFASQTLFHWGLFLILFLIVCSTFDADVFYLLLRYPMDTVALGILAVSVITTIVALVFGRFRTSQGRGGLIAAAVYLLFITLLTYVPQWMGYLPPLTWQSTFYIMANKPLLTGLFILHLLLAVVCTLTVIWFGSLLRRPAVINLGMIAIAAVIFVQYFSWAFDLLPRSFAFIIGGLLILVLGFVLERQRRRLLHSFSTPVTAPPSA
jgi:uncharacterized membrane protein